MLFNLLIYSQFCSPQNWEYLSIYCLYFWDYGIDDRERNSHNFGEKKPSISLSLSSRTKLGDHVAIIT